jgi:transposase
MNSKPRQRYTVEFKAQAVELIKTGKPVSQIAEELGIGSNLLYKWKLNFQQAPIPDGQPQTAAERSAVDELRSLQREVAFLKIENDILKKAAVILGTRPQPNSGK